MDYHSIVPARFLARPNRFIAEVEVAGEPVRAHVKNTGRCRELLLPGVEVFLEESDNPARKTRYSLVAVRKGERLINMDSQAPNPIVEEALRSGWKPEKLPGPVENIRREVTLEDSCFDFAVMAGGRITYLEVKGVTLEEEGKTLFPDAPTERGIKHLRGLIRAREQGFGAWVVFVIQMADVESFGPNDRTHPAFGDVLRQAAAAGVGVCAYACKVQPGRVVLDREVPVIL